MGTATARVSRPGLSRPSVTGRADTEGTKQGRDGLYHAEISPEARYAATMTPEQWKRAAVILGEELGLQDQERAIVLHGGTDGRKHMHIVWARTDIDAMKMISDSNNYQAHERAKPAHGTGIRAGNSSPESTASGTESSSRNSPARRSDPGRPPAGQNVPGCPSLSAKPRSPAIRKPCDDAHAFNNALQDAGYILAKGDTRGFVLVDSAGEVFSLSKHLAGDLKGKAYKDFMAPIDKATLPTIKESKAIHEQRQKEAPGKSRRSGRGSAPAAISPRNGKSRTVHACPTGREKTGRDRDTGPCAV